MIGNNSTYDAIIIEYERRYDMGLANLVERLRNRFPKATIIITNVWTFMNIVVTDENGTQAPFRNWLRHAGYESNTLAALEYVRSVIDDENLVFEYKENRQNLERDRYIEGLVDKYNVKIFDWPKSNMKPIILRYMPLYAEDFVHWSAKGHRFAAKSIEKILKAEQTTRSDDVGSWGDGMFYLIICRHQTNPLKILPSQAMSVVNG